MDDRLAKLLLEDNILSIQKRDSARISLLEKLATIKSVDLQTLPIPGTTNPPLAVDPGGWDKSVQYNDGGLFGGDANFTWDKTAQTLTMIGTGAPNILGTETNGLLFYGGDATTADTAGGFNVIGGGTGNGTGTGGTAGMSGGKGGDTGNGGIAIISGGNSGDTDGDGGDVEIDGGLAVVGHDGNGGSIILTPGTGEGAGVDGRIYLNGSTNGIQIDTTGALTLLGTAKYARHVQIAAITTGNPSNQPADVDFFTVGGLQFATTGSKFAFCQWEIPDDWDGTDIYFEVDWFPDSGAISGTAAVRWTVEYRAIAEGELINNGTSVTLDNGAGGDTADYSQYQTKHTRVTMAYNNANQPLTAQDHLYFKVSRDTGVANDFGGSVTISAYEIIYNSKGFPTN
jgi:hypothetical protein